MGLSDSRRAARRVESGEPHGADERQAKRIVRGLKLSVEMFRIHPFSVRHNVDADRLQLLDLVLSWRNHDRHVAVLRTFSRSRARPVLSFDGLSRLRAISTRSSSSFQCFWLCRTCGRRSAYRSTLPSPCLESRARENGAPNLWRRSPPVVARDQVVLPYQLALQAFLRFFRQVGCFDQLVDVVVEVGIVEMQLRCAVFVEERHRRAVLH